MNQEKGSAQTIVTILIGVGTLFALVFFFGPEEQPRTKNQDPAVSATKSIEKQTPASVSSELPDTLPADAELITGTSTQPPAQLPDDLKKALAETSQELPADIQAQINAAPPELPEDLRRQLNNQPTELPADLQRQLNSPPPPIPDDIRRALETPPRQVSIDEVNTPVDNR